MAGVTRSSSISRLHPIAEAIQYRSGLAARPNLTAYRLFHGDGEGVPGLAVDRFEDVSIIHADSWPLLREWLPMLRSDLAGFRAAYTKVHPRVRGGLDADSLRALAPDEPAWGKPVGDVVVTELGPRYLVRPTAGLSVGLFLDMREVRAWLRESSAGREVLNLFAYTCSLGVCAMLGGARRVLNLDVSRPYLEWGKANYLLNDCEVDPRDFVYGDAFDWLRRLARRGPRFDMVIVDPPNFSSTPFSVTRDYPRLVEAAAGVVAPGGLLLAATNHALTGESRFEAWLEQGLQRAARQGRIIRRWHEPRSDFPLSPGGKPYLKVRAIELD